MATATKKKTKSIGQVAYLTKQVESLEKDLVRKDIEKLESKIDWLKWFVVIGIPIITTLFTGVLLYIILYLHSDTKQDIKELRIELKQDIKDLKQDIKQDINSINTKLDKLIERDLRK